MWQIDKSLAAKSDKGHAPARAEERFVTDLLTTDLGPVVDLSASGLRVNCDLRCELTVGRIIPLVVRSNRGSLTVKCRVARVRKAALSYEVGFAFVNPKPNLLASFRALVAPRA